MPAVRPTAAVPTFISQEQHRELLASTPNSFQDIPPVLRHREDNISVLLDPPLDGFSPEDAAQGTLYVLTRYSILHYQESCIDSNMIDPQRPDIHV
jgi:nucleotide-sensitive chloride channel 1A